MSENVVDRLKEQRAIVESWPIDRRGERDLSYAIIDLHRLTDDALPGLLAAVDALEEMLRLVDRHPGWCGYNKDAPGDSIINRAPEQAREALATLAVLYASPQADPPLPNPDPED